MMMGMPTQSDTSTATSIRRCLLLVVTLREEAIEANLRLIHRLQADTAVPRACESA